MFLSSRTLELCASGSDTTFMPGPAVAFHGWGEVGEEVLFLIPFLRFFLVLPLVFFQTLVITPAGQLLHFLAQKLSHRSAKPPSECEGTERCRGGPGYWDPPLAGLKGQKLCADIQSGLGLQLHRKLI